MSDELKPCPFCGPGESVVDLYLDDVARRWRVGCGRCGASTGIHPRDKTQAPAIAAWNRRAHPPTGDAAGKDSVDAAACMKFAGAVLEAHRNEGRPIDLDGGFLQEAAAAFGLIEARTVYERCGDHCSCAEVVGADEWFDGVECFFTTAAGKAAIASLTKTQS